MSRKEDIAELQGAASALRSFLGVFRHAVTLEGKVQGALRANALLEQCEHDAADLRNVMAALEEEKVGLQKDVDTARAALMTLNGELTTARAERAALTESSHSVKRDLTRTMDAELAEKKRAAADILAGLKAEIDAAQKELRGLRDDARRIRDHFAGAPA